MKIEYKRVESLAEFIDAVRIRVDVFIIEQKCKPGWEPDTEDKISSHYVAVFNNHIVATARVRKIKSKEFKIERMAIKKEYRRRGIGKGLLDYIILKTKKQKPQKIWLQAQVQAQKFYEKCGFKVSSRPYDLWNLHIPHVDMEYVE